MRSLSKDALHSLQSRWEGYLDDHPDHQSEWGDQLFSVSDVLGKNRAFSRSLTDAARTADDRVQLLRSVFDGKVSGEVLDLLSGVVRGSWADSDLSVVIESLGVTSILVSAQHNRVLQQVEAELGFASRLINRSPRLQLELSDPTVSNSARRALINAVFERLNALTKTLVERAARSGSTQLISHWIRAAIDEAARIGGHLVATVAAGTLPSDDQIRRLEEILGHRYGKPVIAHVHLEPELVGGLRVAIGDDVIDGSILARIRQARASLAHPAERGDNQVENGGIRRMEE
ncbi:MAG: F0F1 ATP synthase subunit delta [Actinomycetaceae bacterium]|nr:F0F1 ATP synthase subunit delta [Actinomycetaceae bacterium]MDY6082767.1 F0F1 ATP synthase subunit delta [Actinomycetaceae bacterium]